MVKCADCGLLAAENRGSHELIEVDSRVRLPGNDAIGAIDIRNSYELMPVCCAHAADLQAELAGNGSAKAIQECIQRDRQCKPMRQLVKGRTPQWHLEMLNQENMLAFQAEQRALDRQENQANRRLTLLVAIIGFVSTILAAALGYFLSLLK
jgi:hypothetical protein